MLRGVLLIVAGAALLYVSIQQGFVERRIPFYGRGLTRLENRRLNRPAHVSSGDEAVLIGALGCLGSAFAIGLGVHLIRGGSLPWRRRKQMWD